MSLIIFRYQTISAIEIRLERPLNALDRITNPSRIEMLFNAPKHSHVMLLDSHLLLARNNFSGAHPHRSPAKKVLHPKPMWTFLCSIQPLVRFPSPSSDLMYHFSSFLINFLSIKKKFLKLTLMLS